MITDSDIEVLLSGLEAKLQGAAEYKIKSAQLIGSGFNVFRFIDKERNLSAILAELLNPSGSHGQGTVFLSAFLDLIERRAQFSPIGAMPALQKMVTSTRISVKPEHPTTAGRFIDIVVHDDNCGIGIENKKFGQDLDNQLLDYATYLCGRYRLGWLLLYVSGAGGPPARNSLCEDARQKLQNAGNYLELSYAEDLVEWLDACIHVCDADKVRWFLRDFRDFSMNKFKEGGESR